MARYLLVLALLGISSIVSADADSEKKLLSKFNEQITYELRASYFYQAYSHYFDRSDVALPGLAKWFQKASVEEREHASGLMEYANKRGFKVSLTDLQYRGLCSEVKGDDSSRDACICKFMGHVGTDDTTTNVCHPDRRDEWKNALWAMEDALDLEHMVNKLLLDLHSKAEENNDPHLCHFLEHQYLDEQVEAIKELNDYITQLKRVGEDLGEYLFDKDLK